MRLRHDGRWDFAKELKHPAAEVGKSGPLFAGGLPSDRWLGMKARVRNLPDGKSLRIELFVDSVSRGDTAAARWDRVAWPKRATASAPAGGRPGRNPAGRPAPRLPVASLPGPPGRSIPSWVRSRSSPGAA